MRVEQRAQPVGDAVFEVLRNCAGRHVAVQIAVADALAPLVGQRIGDGHKSNAAALYGQRTRVQLGDKLRDGLRAAGFVAVYGAQHQQARAGCQAVIAHGAKVKGGWKGGRWAGRHWGHGALLIPRLSPAHASPAGRQGYFRGRGALR